MLGIILIILKVIGIVLLFLLALLFILIGIFLFLPVNYRLKASKDAGKARGNLYVNWLFHLFRVCVEYEQGSEMKYSIKVLFFQIFPKTERKEKITKKNKKSSKSQKIKETEKKDKTEESRNNNHKAYQTSENTAKVLQREDIPEENFQKKMDAPKKVPVTEKKKNKSLVDFVKEKIRKLKFTFGKICDKIKEICSGYEKCKEFITSEEMKGSLKFLNEQRKYLVRHLKPSKADIYLHFGTDDPALTGEILALLSVIYPFYGYKLEVVPEFEQVCLDGNIFIKGKIQCYVVLVTVWRAYKNKHIRKMIEKIKK